MYSHIEAIQQTQIKKSRIVLGVEYDDDFSAKYVILHFLEVNPQFHVNDVLSGIWHENSVDETSTYDDNVAIEVYLQKQRHLMQEGTNNYDSLLTYLNDAAA